jgi:lipid II:glycine glycyltransferase (peptidoglycan interpeptide bridge formation enzyme)
MPSRSPPVPAPRSLSVSSPTLKCTDSVKKDFKDDIITFNIGGHIHSTTRSTINENVDCQSLLALIITNQTPTQLDNNGHYFIDRDGSYFRYILNYFRDKKLYLPENFTELKQLCLEAKYYQIDRLINEIENRLNTNNEHIKQLQIGLNFTLISNR